MKKKENVKIIDYEKTKINISLVVLVSVIGSFMLIFYQVIVLTNKLALKDLEQSVGKDITIIKLDIATIKARVNELANKEEDEGHEFN